MSKRAEELFRDAFLPLYPEDARADLATARATDANPSGNPSILAQLEDAAAVFARMAPRAFGEFGTALELDFTDASVHRLSAALSRELRDRWLAEPAFGTAEGTLFNVVVHGSAYVGACVVRTRNARWMVRRPLWESLVALESPAGQASLSIFHWWLKSLADDAMDGKSATLADRYRTHVEVPTFDAAALPILIADDRRLPRLGKVRYDTLYKYMRAHLPELRDLGRDFPSPERLDQMHLRWLDAFRVGDGRMLLLAGPGKDGVYLFWLDGGGFVKSAFVPADAAPEPTIEVAATIRIGANVDRRTVTHEMLWWGP